MIPRTLRVTRDHRIMIKNLEVGKVKKSGLVWKFTGSHKAAPPFLEGPSVKSIKELLVNFISREDYIKLVENQPD